MKPLHDWVHTIEERMPLFGHRNWLVVADADVYKRQVHACLIHNTLLTPPEIKIELEIGEHATSHRADEAFPGQLPSLAFKSVDRLL